VPVLKGREFVRQDTAGSAGVVLVNESLAREFFPNEDPVGRRITILADGADRWLTIVGVVGNVRHWGLSEGVRPQLFRPYTQAGWPCMSIVVRTATSAGGFARTVRRAMALAEPDRALGSPTTMEEVLRGSVGSWRFPMVVLAAFAALALLLAAVGIVGVVGFAVTQRTNEIGIRMALGAGRSEVIGMIVRASMRWVLVGLAAGGVASVAASRLLSGLLYDVKPADPSTLALVAAVLATVAAAASYVPARRVTKIDPLTALRTE
jgi:putative ABC transport system permease protein